MGFDFYDVNQRIPWRLVLEASKIPLICLLCSAGFLIGFVFTLILCVIKVLIKARIWNYKEA